VVGDFSDIDVFLTIKWNPGHFDLWFHSDHFWGLFPYRHAPKFARPELRMSPQETTTTDITSRRLNG
jgi:hypothetical protein